MRPVDVEIGDCLTFGDTVRKVIDIFWVDGYPQPIFRVEDNEGRKTDASASMFKECAESPTSEGKP